MDYAEVEREILAMTIAGEARGEPIQGQIAVAWVVKNRADNPKWWGNDIISVCLRRYQFEMYNFLVKEEIDWRDLYMGIRQHSQWDAIRAVTKRIHRAIAEAVIVGLIPDPTSGSTHYYNPKYASPAWANDLEYVKTIGQHRFYREWIRETDRIS